MTAGPAASRRVGINGRTSPPPDSSLPKVCSFQLPKVCSFRLPLTARASEDMTMESTLGEATQAGAQSSPWLTVKEAAARARCGTKTIYREVKAGRLRAARVGGRRELRFLAEWIDEWLITHCTVREVTAADQL